MPTDTFEFLKWAVGLPAAVATVLTLPLLAYKYVLECKKLRIEIERLQPENAVKERNKARTVAICFIVLMWIGFGGCLLSLYFNTAAIAFISGGIFLFGILALVAVCIYERSKPDSSDDFC